MKGIAKDQSSMGREQPNQPSSAGRQFWTATLPEPHCHQQNPVGNHRTNGREREPVRNGQKPRLGWTSAECPNRNSRNQHFHSGNTCSTPEFALLHRLWMGEAGVAFRLAKWDGIAGPWPGAQFPDEPKECHTSFFPIQT